MPRAVVETMQALVAVVASLPVGTNLGLLHLFWAIVTGRLLPNRGAIFPALQAIGLPADAIRRAWAAMAYGSWEIETLLADWEEYVLEQGQWEPRRHGGYSAVGVDLVPFWRPKLKNCQTKHYFPPAGKALPAIPFGLIVRVGSVLGRRVPIIRKIIRADPDDTSEKGLKARAIQETADTLADDEMPVYDAGFSPKALQESDLKRFLVRLRDNFAGRRNELPEYKGNGRPPEYGNIVRPLARKYGDHYIEATPPDRVETWTENGVQIRAEFWDDLVRRDVKVDPDNDTLTVVAIYDPRYEDPWLLACSVKLSGKTLYGLYRDRWPVEQVPLAAKQILGGERQFVFAEESRQRLPELELLSGAIATYLAATLPATPTGFWDRNPKPTPGRLRRVLAEEVFPIDIPLPERIRKKSSPTEHLPKGILGHRRQKQASSA
jgi:hypothetical protein